MIQLSYRFDAPNPPDPAPPLRLVSDGAYQRLTGSWPHDDLAAARRQAAVALAALPPATPVRCNFTGRTQPAASWVAELGAPPTLQTTFEARHAIVEGRLFARLFGLYQLGESDIVLVADPRSDLTEVYRFLSGWGSFRLQSRDEPAWDRPFPWGYWLVSFADADAGDPDFWSLLRDSLGSHHLRDAFDERMITPAPRLVIEAADPTDPDSAYVIGATSALALAATQRATAQRLGADPAPSPSAQDAAGFCERLVAGASLDFFAYRETAQGPLDSGWRLACTDPDHQHDTASLRIAPLGQADPGLAAYLMLPPGWVVTREDGAYWTNAPGEAESHRDSPPDEPG